MAKFKPFHEFQKPLIGFTPESFLDYIDGTKLKGNASAKRTKDRAGFEKWLSEIEEALSDSYVCSEGKREAVSEPECTCSHKKKPQERRKTQ